MLLRLVSLFQLMHTFIHFKVHQFTLILKTLKNIFKKLSPTCFGPYIRPSSGGSWTVLYAVTKLNSVDVRLLCSCTVCGRMSLSSVVCVCVCVCQPPEDGRTYGPKHVGESFFENVFKMLLNVLSINVNWWILKCIKVCMSWNKGNNFYFMFPWRCILV